MLFHRNTASFLNKKITNNNASVAHDSVYLAYNDFITSTLFLIVYYTPWYHIVLYFIIYRAIWRNGFITGHLLVELEMLAVMD